MAPRTRRRRTRTQPLRLEPLEQRVLLAGDVVSIQLAVVDADGQPVSRAEIGDELLLRGIAQDLRETPDGIFAAFADVTYGTDLVSLTGTPTATRGFVNGVSGDVGTAGVINEVGGFEDLGWRRWIGQTTHSLKSPLSHRPRGKSFLRPIRRIPFRITTCWFTAATTQSWRSRSITDLPACRLAI